MSADLVFQNANILTQNKDDPKAQALAIRGDKIAWVGSNAEAKAWIGKNTNVIDLKGKTVVPGFIDCHIHVADYGKFLTWVDLKNAKSIPELQAVLAERAAKTLPGKWILGRGWDETRFKEARPPTAQDLDSAAPKNPVILYHESAMIGIVNNLALQLSGVNKATEQCGIDKNPQTGEPTGILRNDATGAVWKFVSDPTEEELLDASEFASQKIVEAGVTSVHWMVISLSELQTIKRLRTEKCVPLRIFVVVPAEFLGQTDPALRVGAASFTVDGYLASETAALFEPYNDNPTSGNLLYTKERLQEAVSKALKAGLQLDFHAMGDRAVDLALSAVENAATRGKPVNCRIEHAGVLSETLITRLKKHNVTVSVQPCVVATEYSVWSTDKHLGAERARWLYPLKTLLGKGILLIGGSDCPMEPLNPLLGIQAAALRDAYPKEKISVEQALRMYTIDAAFAAGEHKIKGSIEEGKLADLVILSNDPSAVVEDKIGEIQVEATVIGGKVVYSQPSLQLC